MINVDRSGKLIGKRSISASAVSWSPDGERLFVSDERTGKILNSKLDEVAVVPFKHISSFTWLDDDSVLIGVDNRLWQYDIQSKISKLLTSVTMGNTIFGVYASVDLGQVYFTTRNSERSQIYRVPTSKSQSAVSTDLGKLPLILPDSFGFCVVSYVNFVKPIITVKYPRPDARENCIQTAKDELSYFDINPSLFTFSPTLSKN